MKLYVLIEITSGVRTIRLITDCERTMDEELDKVRKDAAENVAYEVLSTENVKLSSTGMASVSMDYELDCLEETVQYRLYEKGADEEAFPEKFKELVMDIASEAYREMTHYDVSEEYALGEAFTAHSAGIKAITKD